MEIIEMANIAVDMNFLGNLNLNNGYEVIGLHK
jgi:hypothetical protein